MQFLARNTDFESQESVVVRLERESPSQWSDSFV
jgi:hypothetical protein